MPDLAVVVVNYNTAALLRDCLSAIYAVANRASIEVIVVDNASVDGSVTMVREAFPDVHLLTQSTNLGFGTANNVGVASASAPYVMLLNSDAVLLEDTGAALVQYLRDHPDVMCAGPRIVLPNGERQDRAFGNLPSLWRVLLQCLNISRVFPWFRAIEGIDGRHRPGPEDDVGWITGVCMVMRRADFQAVGGFDPSIFMYCEDIDLCARFSQKGGRVVRVDRYAVLHHGGASSPSVASQLRNAVWQQTNLLKIVRARSGRPAALVARVLLFVGMVLRLAAGVALIPKRGVRDNVTLRSSWLRLLDLLRLRRSSGAAVPNVRPVC